MIKTVVFLFLLILLNLTSAFAQGDPKETGLKAITSEVLQAQLEYLASDWTQGRESGTRGEFMAGDYIAGIFEEIGLKPGGDRSYTSGRRGAQGRTGSIPRTFFQNFNLLQTTAGPVQECALIRKGENGSIGLNLEYKVDFSINPGTESIEIEAPIVFVGYGLTGGKYGFDDYKKLDVKGKVIVRLYGFPGFRDVQSVNYARFKPATPVGSASLERVKDSVAIAHGALAIIDVMVGQADNFQTPGNIPFRYNQATYEGDEPFRSGPSYRMELPESKVSTVLPRITLSARAINFILTDNGIDPSVYEKTAANETAGKLPVINDLSLRLKTSVESRLIRTRNVIGVLEGDNSESCIVIGAHYDHTGQVRGFIYNGSDDNASGTVGIMTIARAMVASGKKPKYTIVFCAWTAEEKGLLGSAWFVGHPLISNIRCYMNYDMISRTAPDDTTGMKCDFNYSSGMPLFRELTEKHIREYSIKLDMAYQTSPMPVGGSDFSSFSRKGIPIFLIHGKFTPDYHQFTDSAEKAVLPYFTAIVRLGYLNIFELANKTW